MGRGEDRTQLSILTISPSLIITTPLPPSLLPSLLSTCSCWDGGPLFSWPLFHLDVPKVQDASHCTEQGYLLLFHHAECVHGILCEQVRTTSKGWCGYSFHNSQVTHTNFVLPVVVGNNCVCVCVCVPHQGELVHLSIVHIVNGDLAIGKELVALHLTCE